MTIRYKIKTTDGEINEAWGDVVEKILAPIVIENDRYIVHKFIVRRYSSTDHEYSGHLDFVLPEQDIISIKIS